MKHVKIKKIHGNWIISRMPMILARENNTKLTVYEIFIDAQSIRCGLCHN